MQEPVQLSFDFDKSPYTFKAKEPLAGSLKEATLSEFKIQSNTISVHGLDWDKTIILDRGKRGLRPIPLSDKGLQRLVEVSGSYESKAGAFKFKDKDSLRSILTYQNIVGLDDFNDNNPIIKFFNLQGLEVVLTQHARSYIKNKMRSFKKLITPYKFYAPEQFVETFKDGEVAEANNTSQVPGPYVEDVYKAEINYYKKKIRDFGFDDGTKDFHLFPFQVDDIARLACKRKAFIGLEQGLGKTSIAIGLCHMHGNKRVLVVCPGAAIGSWQSGWRHEIHRMGVPQENIHVMETAQDLPFDWNNKEIYPDNGRPHFFLTNYHALSQEKISWNSYKCAICSFVVKSEEKGKCKNPSHGYNGPRTLDRCPTCSNKKGADKEIVKAMWTGSCCDPGKGGCGWRVWERAIFKKNNSKNPLPMWKRMRRGMFHIGLFDESQMVKNIDTRRSRAVQHIPGLKRTYIITGTMMTNYVQDTFWQLQLLLRNWFPINKQLVNFSACKTNYVGMEEFLKTFQWGNPDGKQLPTLKNQNLLWEMMSTVQVRRRANDPDVDQQVQLPKLTHHTELIEMDEIHKVIYDMRTGTFQKDLSKTLKDQDTDKDINSLSAMDIEQRINALRLVACVPEIDPAYQEKITNKDKRILELIEEDIAKDSKVVIFVSFQAFGEKLFEECKKRGFDPMLIDGRVAQSARWPLIDKWRTEPDNKVMIAGIKSMNYAVNFTSLTTDFNIKRVIFATPEWVPTEMEQAWKRVHRIGQQKDVEVYSIYFKNTVEEYMDKVLYQKRRTIAQAMDRIQDLKREDSVTERSAIEIANIILKSK